MSKHRGEVSFWGYSSLDLLSHWVSWSTAMTNGHRRRGDHQMLTFLSSVVTIEAVKSFAAGAALAVEVYHKAKK